MLARRIALLFSLSLLLAACGQQESAQEAEKSAESAPDSAATQSRDAAETPAGKESASAEAEKTAASDDSGSGKQSKSGIKSRIREALAAEHREKKNRARDKYRNPAKTLAFFGVEPDMTVVELYPGGGWYTEVLAPVLKDEGRLIVAGFSEDSEVEYYARSAKAYNEKLAANPDIYGNVEQIVFMPPDQVNLGEAESADMVLTFRNLHNWHERGALGDVFKEAFRVLKPGGIFGVVEHRAPEGTLVEDVKETGYMPEDYVINLAEETGFELAAKSEINANEADTGDHPMGVWTLPPSLRYCREMDEGAAKASCMEKYRQIGESDRMTLKFVKPAASE